MERKFDLNLIINGLLTETWFEHNGVIFFTGGCDVDPTLYGEPNICSYTSKTRDMLDMEIYNKYKDKPKVGICRGNQFLSVMRGSKLCQDMHHPSRHLVTDTDGDHFLITSTHHQMVYPFNCDPNDYEILWTSYGCESEEHVGVNDQIPEYKEVEAILWKAKEGIGQCLCIQGHPEFGYKYPEYNVFIKKFEELLSKYIYA